MSFWLLRLDVLSCKSHIPYLKKATIKVAIQYLNSYKPHYSHLDTRGHEDLDDNLNFLPRLEVLTEYSSKSARSFIQSLERNG